MLPRRPRSTTLRLMVGLALATPPAYFFVRGGGVHILAAYLTLASFAIVLIVAARRGDRAWAALCACTAHPWMNLMLINLIAPPAGWRRIDGWPDGLGKDVSILLLPLQPVAVLLTCTLPFSILGYFVLIIRRGMETVHDDPMDELQSFALTAITPVLSWILAFAWFAFVPGQGGVVGRFADWYILLD